MSDTPGWLTVRQGKAPLLVSLPHTGTEIPEEFAGDLVSPWLARKDADWWIDRLYDFAVDLDATIVHTAISRTVIDVNRDPSGASLYPGQATTELVPMTTFDGEPLYLDARTSLSADGMARRRAGYSEPYHAALSAEIVRLREQHANIALYDCHSIRSIIPRLFDGELPHFNLGTNSGQSCDPAYSDAIARICGETNFSFVANGRFKGGWITRRYGDPANGVHAIQMEHACRGYMVDPPGTVSPENWPSPYDALYALPMRLALQEILETCLKLASSNTGKRP
jgi:N-formylglutamate deformylase